MTAAAVVVGIAQDMAAAGVGAFSVTDPLPAGATPIALVVSPASPDTALTLTTYNGGPEPDSRNGWEFPRLQVRTRARNPLDALDLDRAAYDALQFRPGGPGPRPLGDGWWLQDCHAVQSEAQPIGQDDNGRPEFTRNYQLTVRRS